MIFIRFLSKYESQVYAILRIITGFLFLWHGSQKLFNVPVSPSPAGGESFNTIFAGIVEFFGGLLVLFGLWTRWAALLACIVMVGAYLTVHAGKGFLPLVNHGEMSLVYFFIFLYMFIRGSGIWSIDNLIKRKIDRGDSSVNRDIPVQ